MNSLSIPKAARLALVSTHRPDVCLTLALISLQLVQLITARQGTNVSNNHTPASKGPIHDSTSSASVAVPTISANVARSSSRGMLALLPPFLSHSCMACCSCTRNALLPPPAALLANQVSCSAAYLQSQLQTDDSTHWFLICLLVHLLEQKH